MSMAIALCSWRLLRRTMVKMRIDCPPLRHTSQTFKQAPKASQTHEQAALGLEE